MMNPEKIKLGIIMLTSIIPLSGCSLQSDYTSPPLPHKQFWSDATVPPAHFTSSPEQWWTEMHDPAINDLVDASFTKNPTLEKAVAQMDEARAQVGVNKADYYPTVSASGSISESKTTVSGGGSGGAASAIGVIPGRSRTSSIGPSLSWELDLFGRIRSSVEVAKRHLDARTADAQYTKLSLAVQVANTVLDLRACEHTAQVYRNEISSRGITLNLIHKKRIAGFSADTDEASVLRDLAAAEGALASQNETCAQDVNALVSLTGRDREAVASLIAAPLPGDTKTDETLLFMPQPPEAVPQLPATILLSHPSIVSADQDAAAAWANIGVARADRLPKIDLAAALTGEWINTAGSTIRVITSSLEPSFSATLLDGGKGAANVDVAEAQYRQSVANLQATVRTTVKEVENALAAEQSAGARMITSKQSEAAAKTAFTASEAQWKSGMASLLELEDSRRQYATAQDSVIGAARDRAKAWVSLISATGNSTSYLRKDAL
jgi:NodT family efflux transporter outer membrane factor (OMF) lipoprotein